MPGRAVDVRRISTGFCGGCATMVRDASGKRSIRPTSARTWRRRHCAEAAGFMNTEDGHPKTNRLDRMSSTQLAQLLTEENSVAVSAAVAAHSQIAQAIEWVAKAFQDGGRIVYVGAGTSGRIAAGDVAEMAPTFGVEPGRFIAVIAGAAIDSALEGAEDDTDAAHRDLLA